jgi:phosphoribosylanthranilate isomerase
MTFSVSCFASAEAGADAIGLNFYAKSKRFVQTEAAIAIANAVRGRLAIVGVFVNVSAEDIFQVTQNVGLEFVQLHGDEEPEFAAKLRQHLEPSVQIIRAIRVPADDLEFAQKEAEAWDTNGADLFLLDPASADEFGGTGKRLNWSSLSGLSISKPWLLAGGLTPDNVFDAIQAANPSGADVASGVEVGPGIKSKSAIERFVSKAQAALKENLSNGL